MRRNNIILLIITIVTFLALVIGATYAYFSTGNMNITNVANANTVTERNNMVLDTLGGGMSLNITTANMVQANNGTVAAENNTTLTVNFTANTDYSMVCTYDIVYEWTSSDKYLAHSSGVSGNEFTIQGTLANNANVSEGTNNIKNETDLSTLSYTNYAATVVSGAQIDGTGNTTSTAVWTLTSKFYNVNADQSTLSGKTYAGKFRVANVSCVGGKVTKPGPTGYWFQKSAGENTFPTYLGTLYDNPSALSARKICIGQDNIKYYVCAISNGNTVCLSQPYTQYGLEGHTAGNDFSAAEQASAVQALEQIFSDGGINVNCSPGNRTINCGKCTIEKDGDIFCMTDSATCWVTVRGTAKCDD